jgi:hypothetical protein
MSFNVNMRNTIAQIGDKVHGNSAGAQASLAVEGMSGQKACFISDKGYFYNTTIRDGETLQRPLPAGLKFVRVEVRNVTDDFAIGLTNPVWFI